MGNLMSQSGDFQPGGPGPTGWLQDDFKRFKIRLNHKTKPLE